MNKVIKIALTSAVLLTFTACNEENGKTEAKVYKYSTQEVYKNSCFKCHGANGEGNPAKKTPALNDRTAGEMAQDLYDVKNGGTNQSSGTDHEIMEHNMQKLIEKGYDYDIESMAAYLSELVKNSK